MTKLMVVEQFYIVRERLIELMAEKIYPFNIPCWEKLSDEPYETNILGTSKTVTQPGKNYYRQTAIEILKDTYPEIEWE